MGIEWRDVMSVDQGHIDEDHKYLIRIFNRFEAAAPDSPAQIEQVFGELCHYAVVHFGREEALMQAAAYPFLGAHKREHRALVAELRQVNLAFGRPGIDAERIHRGLSELLKVWLTHHIIRSDLRLRPYAARMRQQNLSMEPLSDPRFQPQSSARVWC